jgi:hypothetical protein
MAENDVVEKLCAELAHAAAELAPDAPMAIDLELPEPEQEEQ